MKLTGCNWLHTIQPKWLDYNQEKEYDISCMFGYPTKDPVYEHELCQTDFYDFHRKKLIDKLKSATYNIVGLKKGVRVSLQEYYNKMFNSKIIMAPLGYGAMALRDLESAIFGSVLIKPDMSFIDSIPFIYEDNETYIAVKYDWSDLEEKIEYVFSDYYNIRNRLIENMRVQYIKKYDLINLVKHIYNIFKNLDQIEEENQE